ncbi:MAG: BACON domain-containing protein [Bacteroidaceae bacterium]|nr:BACON domain-containing protein [Bacteroidaceae bacterium]
MKNHLLPAVIALAALLTACESESSYHETSFSKNSVVMYADQLRDSLLLYYTDAWTATLNDDSWCSVSPASGQTEKGAALMAAPVFFTTTSNTTGATRVTNLFIKSHQDGAITVMQLPVLNITYPYYQLSGSDITLENVKYSLDLLASATAAHVEFTVYQDDATLQSDASWISIAEPTLKAGTHRLDLPVQPNTAAEARTATLTLTSGGVACTITINQDGKATED